MGILPKDVDNEIRKTAFSLCEEHGYGDGSRKDSAAFIDMLYNRPDIGGRLREYLPASKVRVHIKDSICGKYTKDLIAKKMEQITPEEAIRQVYNVNVFSVGESGGVGIYKVDNEPEIYLFSNCTLVRWESALRRILEYIAKTPIIYNESERVRICLLVVDQTNKMTNADKIQLKKTMEFVKTKPLII